MDDTKDYETFIKEELVKLDVKHPIHMKTLVAKYQKNQ